MKYQQGPLRFRGTPNRLLATLELPEGPACESLPRSLSQTPVPCRSAFVGSAPPKPIVSTLSFRLPKSTPPGSYEGNVELGEKRIPILVDVEPRASLRFIRSWIRCRENDRAPGSLRN